jgi:hypothetical protein
MVTFIYGADCSGVTCGMFVLTTVLVGFAQEGVYCNCRAPRRRTASERRLAMLPVASSIITAISVTSEMMVIFFCAFFVVYLLALALLPLERGLSKYVWDHTSAMKPVGTKSSFKEFSQKHRQ